MNESNTQKVVLAVIAVFTIVFLFDSFGSGLTGSVVWKGWGGCSGTNQCNNGEGDCDNDGECVYGLKCVDNVGRNYGFSSVADICEGTAAERPAAGKPVAVSKCTLGSYQCGSSGNQEKCVATNSGSDWQLWNDCSSSLTSGKYCGCANNECKLCNPPPAPVVAPDPVYSVQALNYKGQKVLCNGNYDLDNNKKVDFNDWIVFAQKFQKKDNAVNYNKDLLQNGEIINDYDSHCMRYFGYSNLVSAQSCAVADTYRCNAGGGSQEKCVNNVWTRFNDCTGQSKSLTCFEGNCAPVGQTSTARASDATCEYNKDCYLNQGSSVDISENKITLVSVDTNGAVTIRIDSNSKIMTINPSETKNYLHPKFNIRNKQVVYNPTSGNAATIIITPA